MSICRLVVATLASLLLAWGSADRANAFQIGISQLVLGGADTGERVQQIKASGAEMVRIGVRWSAIAQRRPEVARDPNDPAYDWRATDRAVQTAQAAGLQVLLTFQAAPRWAEGAGRPAAAWPGSWKPRIPAVAKFATALARRYPGVHQFQVWNEPNIPLYFSPQYVKRRRTFRAFAAGYYRRMLNAAYAAIKGVNSANRVFAAGTAPYGDPAPWQGPAIRPFGDVGPGGARTRPAQFWRQLLCVRKNLARGRKHCSSPAHLDVLDHHPYPIGGPLRHAINPDDIAIPDVRRLGAILAAARRHHTVLPRGRKALAVTEFSWDSKPPDPHGVPAHRHAAWLADAFYVLWTEHVRTALWFQIVDQPPIPSYLLTLQSGLYLRSGRPKLAQRSFAFPFVCRRRTGGRYRIWGMAPQPRRGVTVQSREGGRWRTVTSTFARGDRVFTAKLSGRPGRLRAVQAGDTSLACSLDARWR